MQSGFDLSRRWARVIVWALVLAYIGLFSWLSLTRHLSFATDAYDLGNVNQAVWNTVHGRPLYFTNWRGVELTLATDNRLAMHVEPIYFLIAPIYWLWQRPEMLLIIQTVVIALGAWPVYWLAGERLRNRLAGIAFVLVYLLFPGLEAANLWEFHAVALAASLLLFTFYFGQAKRWGLMWLFAVLAMGTKEEIPLTVMLMGLYFFASGAYQVRRQVGPGENKRLGVRQILRAPAVRHGLALALVGALWFTLAVFVVIPIFGGQRSPYLDYYQAALGGRAGNAHGSLVAVVWGLITTFFNERNIQYLVDLYTPVGFISFLSPLTLLFSAPDLLINLLSDHEPMHFVQRYHYVAPMAPGVMISAILGAAWLLNRLARKSVRRRSRLTLALIVFVLSATGYYHYYHGFTPLARAFGVNQITAHHRLGEEIAREIPIDAIVSAQRNLNPHVSGRKGLYRFPYIGDAEYIFLDLSSFANDGARYDEVRGLIEGDEFGVIRAEDGYLLLQRGAPPGPSLTDDFFSFVYPDKTPAPEYAVDIDFGESLKLIGYDLWHARYAGMPQTPIRLTLYWQVMQPVPENYRVLLYLLDRDRNVRGTIPISREPGLVYWYPTSQWRLGEIVQMPFANMPWWTAQFDSYGVALGVERGDDPWDTEARLRPRIGESGWKTAEVSDGTLVELMHFTTDPGGMPVRRESRQRFETPRGVEKQEANWANGLQLLGYKIKSSYTKPGDQIDVTLVWRTKEPLDVDYTVFVHMVGADGKLYAQHDAEPDLSGFPTSVWIPGEVISDRHPLDIPANTPSGAYRLYVGFYDRDSGERVQLREGGDFLQLQTGITVE